MKNFIRLSIVQWLILTAITLIFGNGNIYSQTFKTGPEQDCANAIPICAPYRFNQSFVYLGQGSVVEGTGSSCGVTERNSTIYRFTLSGDAEIWFTITPVNPNDNFDWILYDITAGCGGMGAVPTATGEVSCNRSDTPGATGINNTGTANTQGQGGTPINAVIRGFTGQSFALLITTDSAVHDGYSVDFTNTRPIGGTTGAPDQVIAAPTPPAPTITAAIPENYCGKNSKLTVQFDNPVVCNTVDNIDFEVTGPGGPYTILAATSPDCSLPDAYITEIELTIAPPLALPTGVDSGNYTVKISSASDAKGFCGVSATGQKIFKLRNLRINAGNDVSICAGDSAALLAIPAGPAVTYQISWSPTEGLDNPNVPNPVARPTITTLYVARIDDFAEETPCFAVDTMQVEVRPLPIPVISRDTTICSYGFAQLQVSGGVAYQWSPSIGLTSTTTANPQARPTTTTTYSVVVQGANGCIAVTSVTVTPAPPVVATVVFTEASICVGESVLLQAGGGARYLWTPAEGLSNPFSNSPRARPTVTTNYKVYAFNSINCVDSAIVRVVVKPTPVLEDIPNQTICLGSSVVLTATGANVQTYRWSPAEGLSCTNCPNPIATPSRTTTYTVTVGNLSSDCTDDGRVTITVGAEAELRFPNITGDTIAFGELSGCETERVQEVEIFNTCDKRVDITGVFFSDAQFTTVEDITLEKRVIIPAFGTAKINFRFTPTTSANVQAQVVLLTATSSKSFLLAISGKKPARFLDNDNPLISIGETPFCSVPLSQDTSFTLSNISSQELTLERPRISSTAATLVNPAQYPLRLLPGGQHTVRLRFAPIVEGNNSVRISTIYFNDQCRDSAVTRIQAQAIAPRLSVSTDTLRFAALKECDTLAIATTQIQNTSSLPITITSLTTNTPFLATDALPFTLQPNEVRTITLECRPQQTGGVISSLLIESQPCGLVVPVVLSAVKEGVSFTTPAQLDLGSVPTCAGVPTSATLIITNTADGNTEGVIEEIIINGPFTTNLAVGETIGAGTSLSRTITFVPTAEGIANGTLQVRLSPCNIIRQIALTARQVRAELTGGGTVSFGTAQTGIGVRTRTIVWRNTGETPITVNTLEGLNAPFTVQQTTPALPAVIAAGDSLTVTAEFRPVTEGRATNSITLRASAPCPLTFGAVLEGEGTAVPIGRILAENTTAAATLIGTTSPLAIPINNDGDLPAEFLGWTVVSGSGFSVTSVALSVPIGGQRILDGVFTPTVRGTQQARLRLFFDIDTVEVTVNGDGLLAAAEGNLFTIGSTAIRTAITGSAQLVNTGDVTLQIVSAQLLGGAPFSITPPAAGTPLSVSGALPITIEFAPQNVGLFTDTIRVVLQTASGALQITTDIPIQGTGTVRAFSRVQIQQLSAASGEIIRIPLLLNEERDLLFTTAENFRVVLRFNSSLLAPRGTLTPCTFEDGFCRLEVIGRWNRQTPTLTTLEFEALLGNAEQTDIEILEFVWTDANDVDVETDNGLFVLSDICRAGGTRLINSSGTLKLNSITPNPISGEGNVSYEVIERGYTRLSVFDALGREVMLLVDGEVIPGAYSVGIPSTLPNGTYTCVLRTPTLTRSQRFITIR